MPAFIPSAKATLSYPLYACDFDPSDATRLVVGGGGGAGRSGVGNKITLFDTSDPKELVETGEVDLSKDEDNVTSLAVAAPLKGTTSLVFAGVNSSPSEVEKGTNKHFRIFGIDAVGKGKKSKTATTATSKLTEILRATLFQGKEKDVYQRITRLSKPFPKLPQLGAVTTGLAKTSEIVLFDTSATNIPVSRGAVQSNKEAVDVDFIQTGASEYLFAYCDIHDIYLKKISSTADTEEPECVYITPGSRESATVRAGERPTIPTFRALRFLTKEFILMLTNIHGNQGVVVQIFRIPPGGKGQCRVAQSIRLGSDMKKATGIAVANLTPPTTPDEAQDYTQFVIAVAGHDISISLYKVDLQVEANITMVSSIKSFRTFKNVHPLQITNLAFSNFTPPKAPITAGTPQQTLKLASVGVSNTVVVHTIPLFPVPLSMAKGQSKTPRYVVALPSKAQARGISAAIVIIIIALISMFVQTVMDIRKGGPGLFGVRDYLPLGVQEALGKPYEFPFGYGKEGNVVTITTPAQVVTQTVGYNHHLGVPADGTPIPLHQLVDRLKEDGEGTVVLSGEDGVEAKLHKEEHGDHGGKKWEELGKEQKSAWMRKLKDAGHWVEDMGETVLKGVVFSELAGAVGQAVGG